MKPKQSISSFLLLLAVTLSLLTPMKASAGGDHGSSPAMATPVDVGTAAEGFLHTLDEDYFGFYAEEGATYLIGTELGTLTGSAITLYDDGGSAPLLSSSSTDYSPEGLTWTCASSGMYYVKVEELEPGTAYSGAGGTYSLVIVGNYHDDLVHDHGDSYLSATPIEVGTTALGFNSKGVVPDKDYFSFEAQAGTTYVIGARYTYLMNSGHGTDTVLYLYDTDGDTLIAKNDDYGEDNYGDNTRFFASGIYWTCDVSGTYYINVESRSGAYILSVSTEEEINDDHGNDYTTATPVTVGAAINGSKDHFFDEDYFSFDAIQGESYVIKTELYTLGDSVLHLYDTDGASELAVNDDLGSFYQSKIYWDCTTTGTYYVKVRAYSSADTGTYSLSISTSPKMADDHGSTYVTATPVTVDIMIDGNIDYSGDADYFSFEAQEGTVYNIESTMGTLFDYYVRLYGTDGVTELDSNDYLIGVLNYSGRFYFTWDWWDYGKICATPGVSWTCPATGTYYVKISGAYFKHIGTYSLLISTLPGVTDDHGNHFTTATPVAVDSCVDGNIDYAGDSDFFSFVAEEWTEYEFEVTHGTLEKSAILLYDSNGKILSTSKKFNCNLAGTYYIKIKGGQPFYRWYYSSAFLGTYSLSFTKVVENPVEDPTDDHGNYADTATPINLDTPVNVEINSELDKDYLSLEAVRGTSYEITSILSDYDQGINVTLYDDAHQIVTKYEHSSFVGVIKEEKKVRWLCTSSGTYYLLIYGVSDNNNVALCSYTLSVSETSATDDHGNAYFVATPVTVDTPVNGSFDSDYDIDYFSFEAQEGESYLITTLNQRGGYPPFYTYKYIYDTDGVTELVHPDSTKQSSTFWTCEASGVYYIGIKESRLFYGDYILTVSSTSIVDDHGNTLDTATPLTVNTPVNGMIQYCEDIEYFSFKGEEGVYYKFKTGYSSLGLRLRLYDQRGNRVTSPHLTGMQIDISSYSIENVFRCLAPGTYYIKFEYPRFDSPDCVDSGTYKFTLSTIDEDHGNDYTAATPVDIGTMVDGNMKDFYDIDYFSFEAKKGKYYYIETTLNSSRRENAYYVLHLYDADGVTEIATTAYDGGLHPQKMFWKCSVSGTYYVKVRYYFKAIYSWYTYYLPHYTLSISSSGNEIIDDHGDYYTTATHVTVGPSVAGNIERKLDIDFFKFNVTAGTTYTITATPDTLAGYAFRILGPGGPGGFIYPHLDSDDGIITIEWTAQNDGICYVVINAEYWCSYAGDRNYCYSTGTYTVSVDSDGTDPGDDTLTYYTDSDLDGYGDSNDTTGMIFASDPGSGWSLNNTDCDDTAAGINPAAIEIHGDGIDQNCDGITR
jgi:hypothetical protein